MNGLRDFLAIAQEFAKDVFPGLPEEKQESAGAALLKAYNAGRAAGLQEAVSIVHFVSPDARVN